MKRGALTTAARSAVILDGETLASEAVVGLTRGGFPVSLSAEGRRRNEPACQITLKLLEGDAPVYGTNSGAGSLRPEHRHEPRAARSVALSKTCPGVRLQRRGEVFASPEDPEEVIDDRR